MPLSAGEKLGPYEILAPIGAGGMGEVYRARDPRVGREVAIKVSAERFSDRFEIETRAIAALNHPNICQLYDVGPNFLVMELIEGEQLKGPVPIETALNYAKQIADALNAAHEKGIIHRDLKPANIKVKPDGTIKVLDFGLAKSAEQPGGNAESSPTLTISPTRAGMILGTAAYMSPEQARGKPVDKRADIWAFGVVLYETLTGEKMFHGETITDLIASVVKEQPDLERVPAQVRRLLQKCLEKDPRQRLRDIGDWRLLLADAPKTAVDWHRTWLWPAVAAALLLALAAISFIHFREKPPAADVVRFDIPAPEKNATPNGPRISPDGRRIAFAVRDQGGKASIWVHTLESHSARRLAGTEGVTGSLLWSPDSRFIGFTVPGKLKKVEATGGLPQTVCDLSGAWRGGSWSPAGAIVFSTGKGLMRVSDAGGAASVLLAEAHTTSPFFLPDGRRFLYQRSWDAPENIGIYLGSLDAKPEQLVSKRLAATPSSPVYAPSSDLATGYLLFVREGTLMAQLFDSRKLELAGEAMPIAEGFADQGPAPFSASTTGVLAYGSSRGAGLTSQLTWYDRTGKILDTVGELDSYYSLALSPDGLRIAVERDASGAIRNTNIWILESSLGAATRFTFGKSIDWMPVWSPDGSQIVWSSRSGGRDDLYQKASSGAGKEDLLVKSSLGTYPNDWSRDGRFLLYTSLGKGSDLWVLPMTGDDRKPRLYVQTGFAEMQARFSPDTRWVAYTSDESGRNEVYVRPFPDASGGKWQVSKGGGDQPQWRRDGRELFYISADSKMMAVEVSANPSFRSGAPKALFVVPALGGGTIGTRYRVSADGKKFLINCLAASSASAPITVVLNWQAGLKK
ncbi:MAG: serine/threonine protein kinase [Candidatus Solibacter sp.]|nr:serine/threonine protein kinase [Candidatus Solibacter sp.]